MTQEEKLAPLKKAMAKIKADLGENWSRSVEIPKLEDVIRNYVDGVYAENYSQITDMIYKTMFKEYANEYKEMLEPKKREWKSCRGYVRHLLSHLSGLENAVAFEISKTAKVKGKLTLKEIENLMSEIVKNPMVEPYIMHIQGIVTSRAIERLRYKQ